jgi:hypothetical protein
MENKIIINDCVEFKNELHKKLFIKSGAKDFNEYIKFVNSNYSYNKKYLKNGACLKNCVNGH